MHIRDRIKQLRRVPASELKPNPANWRTHPPRQADALRGILAEVGYASALLARELADGSLELIDGHLRAETTPESLVPVLVLDVNEAEAAKLLATFDPLGAMAGTDDEKFRELAAGIETENAELRALLERLAEPPPPDRDPPDVPIGESYQIIVQCNDEAEQRHIYDDLTAQGYLCRVLTL